MTFFQHLPPDEIIHFIVFSTLMIIAAGHDFLTMKIPNRVNILIAGGSMITAAASGVPPLDILAQLGIGAGAILVLILPFSRGWMGGGDVKMIAASVMWFPLAFLVQYLTIISLFGGALTLLIVFLRCVPAPLFMHQYGWFAKLTGEVTKVPYGIAIGLGGIAAKLVEFQSAAL